MSRADLFVGGGVKNASGSSIFCVLSSVCGGASGCGGAFSLAGADVGAVVTTFVIVLFGVWDWLYFLVCPIFLRAVLGMLLLFPLLALCLGVTVIVLAVTVAGRSVCRKSAFYIFVLDGAISAELEKSLPLNRLRYGNDT